MAFEPTELTLVGNGHIGKFQYSLADGGGWNVRSELDNRTLTVCHCHDWHKVERMRTHLEVQLWRASLTVRDKDSGVLFPDLS